MKKLFILSIILIIGLVLAVVFLFYRPMDNSKEVKKVTTKAAITQPVSNVKEIKKVIVQEDVSQPLDNLKEVKRVTAKDGLSPQVLVYAVNGYRWAVKNGGVSNTAVLTIVDFNKPSNEKRLWVIDLKNDHVLMHLHVAQGKNTGKLYATHFSNRPGSDESSAGVYTTASVFEGEHGESLHVKGLEKGINSNAASRAIEIHPAWYVTPAFIKDHGYAGRSWGCFAVNPVDADKFIGYVKDGSVLFAYGTPEKLDPKVDHPLSKKGEKMYTAIAGIQKDPVLRFYQSF